MSSPGSESTGFQRLLADGDAVGAVIEIVRDASSKHGVASEHVAVLELICDELVSNIRRYAYGGETREFAFGIEFEGDTSVLRFVDSGPPFDLTEKAAPQTDGPPEDRQIGGLGIFLVRNYADVEYERRGDLNVVTVRRRITPPASA